MSEPSVYNGLSEKLSVILSALNRQGVFIMPKKAALQKLESLILYFIGDRGNTWKTLRYYSFPLFSFFIHENKKNFSFLHQLRRR